MIIARSGGQDKSFFHLALIDFQVILVQGARFQQGPSANNPSRKGLLICSGFLLSWFSEGSLELQSHTFRYSMRITNSNSAKSVRKAISSITPLLSTGLFEIVVVDNQSSDGSGEFLRQLYDKGVIHKFRSVKCSRGRGRNLASLMASGQYLLANIDTDVVYDSCKILEVLKEYHERFEGKVLSITGMMILPREVALRLGGWKDLDRHEDNEISLNAYSQGLHAQKESVSVISAHLKQHQGAMRKILEAYVSYRDWFRIGLKLSDLPRNQLYRTTVLMGYLSSKFHKKYPNPLFSEWWKLGWSGIEYGARSSHTHPAVPIE
jgi:glycosyltransferase involved in cell wall biosynthesis